MDIHLVKWYLYTFFLEPFEHTHFMLDYFWKDLYPLWKWEEAQAGNW